MVLFERHFAKSTSRFSYVFSNIILNTNIIYTCSTKMFSCIDHDTDKGGQSVFIYELVYIGAGNPGH